jgi:hypothetical protein
MRNNNFFRVGMLAMALAFGMTVIGCDNNPPGGEDETLPALPSSTGPNELGGKSYVKGDDKWEFNADGTYKYFDEDDGKWIEEETGNYSWDSSGVFKTVTLAPQYTTAGDGSSLYDKAGLKVAIRNLAAAQGLTEANVAQIADGQFKTIKAYIDAYADYTFALQLCNYTMSGEDIGTFVEMGAYGYANAKGGKVVVQNDTSSTLTVTTHNATATPATATVPAEGSKEVFTSGDDTFLTKVEITSTGSFRDVEIKDGNVFGGSNSASSADEKTSHETRPIAVGGGRTITITVK